MSSAGALQGCVASLRSSMQLLDSSINILESGVSDFPRLTTVLQTTRHFELVSEADLRDAQSSLLNEIQPEVENLLSRVDTYLDKLERREKSLIAKCELQEGRLGRASVGRASGSKSPGFGSRQASGQGESGLKGLEEVKAMQLRQKKERLSYAVGRLELQANQRERQLRKSMAFQGTD
ncbi:DASH complex subunit Spc19 [Elsinoe ampelina]|uniref:DASH complex subunit SPC19 n=1 Tax=Elsinoe ampelina TaxID=302913 RepID=A0A6A6G3C5_9PEZI|nr:DASH complex subunit Spc19 [Elsinoe ampelina]